MATLALCIAVVTVALFSLVMANSQHLKAKQVDLEEHNLRVTSLSECWTPAYGRSPTVLTIKASARHPLNGRVAANPHPTSLATRAKYYQSEGPMSPPNTPSPRDYGGHGTHTTSIAAVCPVPRANLYSLAAGTTRGGVPSARITVYKICWHGGCSDAHILAAFDDAIADGVDIISISVWGLVPVECRCTIDRKFLTRVKLGNKKTYEGVSVNTFTLDKDDYPLVYGGNVANTSGGYNNSESRYCLLDSLDPELANGTIVLCDGLSDGEPVVAVAAARAILYEDQLRDASLSYPLPASYLGLVDGPDLTAPVVHILAAWFEASTASGYPKDTRVVVYNIVSGTSMSCPHASGAAAYVKSFNPIWSPAAIKSALMTTSCPMSVEKNGEAKFAYGSGNINPLKAKSPGLVYDMGEADYVRLPCGQGYSDKNLQLVTGDNSTCTAANNGTVYNLNYPSFSVSSVSGSSVTALFHRSVMNVGSPSSTYKEWCQGVWCGMMVLTKLGAPL
ncbi:hypothetical protein SASPL_104852 [Salvia splendens]|uniref:Peptidase S8/S53 domain-containing protein n=1 Tax=Salvia splendens TaxID=180675 RepID=A0A8X9AB26_SALSN|nr:hypothetical protein SASPL_104852 [Salvia splendens]